jgi:hypothetical protein
MAENNNNFVPEPGTCVPWSVKLQELGKLPGNEEIVKQAWENLDALAYGFIWFWVQR